MGPANTASASSSFSTTSFFRFFTSIVAIALPSGLLDQNIGFGRLRHSAAYEQKIVFLIDTRDAQIPYGDVGISYMARYPHFFNDARRKRRSADRTRRAMEHRAVRGAVAAKVMPFDQTGEAVSFAGADHVHQFVGIEDVDH